MSDYDLNNSSQNDEKNIIFLAKIPRTASRTQLSLNNTINLINPFDAQWCHMGTAIKYPMPGRVKPSFVIFDIRAL